MLTGEVDFKPVFVDRNGVFILSFFFQNPVDKRMGMNKVSAPAGKGVVGESRKAMGTGQDGACDWGSGFGLSGVEFSSRPRGCAVCSLKVKLCDK